MLLKNLKGDAVWVLLARLIIGGSSMAMVAILSRLMSPDDLGHYMLLMSLVLGVSIFSLFGMDQTSVRELARYKAKHDTCFPANLVRNFYIVSALAASIVCLVLFLAKSTLDEYFFKSPVLNDFFIPTCLWVVFLVFAKLSTECFRGMHKVFVASLVGETLSVVVLMVIVTTALIFDYGLDLVLLVYFMVVAYGLSSVIGIFLLSRYCSNQQNKHNIFSIGDAYAVGRPLTLIAVVSFFISQADLWVLALFFEAKEVAIYGVVLRLMALLSIPLMIVNLVIKPYIPSLYEKGEKKKLEHMLRTVCTLLFVPSAVVLLGLFFYGEAVLVFLFGETYGAGSIALSILVFATLFQIGTGSCGTLLIMTGYQKDVLYISLMNGVILFISLFFLVKSYGMVGAAISTTISAIVQNLAMLLRAHARTGMWTLFSTEFNLKMLQRR